MADPPSGMPPPDDPFKGDTEEFKDRLADARRQKEQARADLQEALFFTFPALADNISSMNAPATNAARDEAKSELSTDIGTECSTDFATEVFNGFFPPNDNWVRSKPGELIDEATWSDIEDDVAARDDTIFRAIKGSNFEAALAMALIPDLSVGTLGMIIDDPGKARPVCCSHVPIRELEINNNGTDVDDRFAVRWVKGRRVKSLLPGVALPQDIEEEIKKNPATPVQIAWGWWRVWDATGETVWRHCVAVRDKVVASDEKRGEGSCGLIVMRFAPHALSPWGNGPARQSLPTLRVLDIATQSTHDRFDISNAPPMGFPDDGVTNFEGGLEAGKAYPMRPGSGRDVVKLYFEGDPNVGFYTLADLEKRVKRTFFADYPEQRGKTPPTASQWLDEMVMAQRRIGTPGVAFWREGPAEIFRRFENLLTARGTIKPIMVGGRGIALVPDNPATKAQEQQEVQTSVRILEIVKTAFPQTSQAAIDELQTIDNLKRKSGDKLIALRPKAAVEKLIQGMLAGAAQAAGAGGGGQGAPTAQPQ